MISKFNKFINEEVGMRNISSITKNYKECEIYFHMDLDGIASALSMKYYLKNQYDIELHDCHIIQYGGIQYAVSKTPVGIMPVLVDFANAGSTYVLATDHHDRTRGIENVPSGYSKHARSNAETLSGEIPKTDAFPNVDIELIKTVDSADFLSHGVKPEDISRSIFSIDPKKSASENRFMMGFVVNRLLLAYKNKLITVTSLDGKRKHINKNLLECLVLDCTPSLASVYSNLKHYIRNAESEKWNKNARVYEIEKLASPEELQKNQDEYVQTMKNYKDLSFDKEYGINIQVGGGNMFAPGSYDRYTVFRNNPDIDFNVILWPMGLLQASCNPFKQKVLEDINLGAIAKEVLAKFEVALKKIFISIDDIKRISEMDISKFDKTDARHSKVTDRVGFKFEDLVSFYKGMMKYQPNIKSGDATLMSFDADSKTEYNEFVKLCMDKLHASLNQEERKELAGIKISAWDIIMANSGGHKSITNISALNFLAARRDGLKRFFGSEEYVDFAKLLQKEFVATLKTKIDEVRAGNKVSAEETAWGNTALTENKENTMKHIKRFGSFMIKESVNDELIEIENQIKEKYGDLIEETKIIADGTVLVIEYLDMPVEAEVGSFVSRTEATIKITKNGDKYTLHINGISGQYGCDEEEDDDYEAEIDYQMGYTSFDQTMRVEKDEIIVKIDDIISDYI